MPAFSANSSWVRPFEVRRVYTEFIIFSVMLLLVSIQRSCAELVCQERFTSGLKWKDLSKCSRININRLPDRLMVGPQTLNLSILVRIQVWQLTNEGEEVLRPATGRERRRTEPSRPNVQSEVLYSTNEGFVPNLGHSFLLQNPLNLGYTDAL